MRECPYIRECKQKIDEVAFYLCVGELDVFDYKDCLESNSLELASDREELKLPREWDDSLTEGLEDLKSGN